MVGGYHTGRFGGPFLHGTRQWSIIPKPVWYYLVVESNEKSNNKSDTS